MAEAGRGASLKTAYRSTTTSEREGNMNLIQLQSLVEVDALREVN